MEKVKNKVRKVFTVIIQNKEYDVYDIEGKEHHGWNDTPKSWWLYYADRLPEGTLPPIDSEDWQPWSVGINRQLWEFKIKQHNTSKVKWDDYQFSNHTSVEMWCNDKHIYSFGTTGNAYGLSFAMSKIGYLQVALSEHPYNFFDTESERGRKIYWYGLPASIRPSSHPGEIGIIPDYEAGLTKEEWWKELKRRETKIGGTKDELDKQWDEIEEEEDKDSMERDYINWGDALSDGHINWFRQ